MRFNPGRLNSCPQCRADLGVQPRDARGQVACPSCGIALWSLVHHDRAWYYTESLTKRVAEIRKPTLPADLGETLSLEKLGEAISWSGLIHHFDAMRIWESQGARNSREALLTLIEEGVFTEWQAFWLSVSKGPTPFIIDGYKLLSCPANGHTSHIAVAERDGVPFLLKFAKPKWSAEHLDAELRAMRRVRSAKVAQCCWRSMLAHPTCGELACLISDYIDGESLRQTIYSVGPLPLEIVAKVIADTAEGLSEMHEAEVIHRRISPAKILVCSDGGGKLIGTGFAQRGQPSRHPSSLLVTSPFVAPEQAMLDGRGFEASDVYSLGTSLISAVTGEREPAHDDLRSHFGDEGQGLLEIALDMVGEIDNRPTAADAAKRLADWLSSF